ncbi:MAG TPA: glycosyltransferase family 4 protein, partial [bacterium]|nr:glycosyltransferase family 4 protein [bacterium]
DIIHCHDWMTYCAGIAAKDAIGKPLVVHVHATEYDRTGGNPNPHVYDIERQGMEKADMIFAVSNFTKYKIVEHYGIHPDKIQVVYNAVEHHKTLFNAQDVSFGTSDKVVLFLGRITLQKGPDYFIKAACKVLSIDPEVKFIVVGGGDMEAAMIREAAELGISRSLLFAGFLSGQDVDRAFQMADLYVMPSVSEPFGITPLEALINGTPVIISKQSGVSEVLHHALKVDFWDVDELANKMVAVLRYQESLGQTLVEHGQQEVYGMTWEKVGATVKSLYERLVA